MGEEMKALFAASPFGANAQVWAPSATSGTALLFTEPVDFLIGSTYGKYLSATPERR